MGFTKIQIYFNRKFLFHRAYVFDMNKLKYNIKNCKYVPLYAVNNRNYLITQNFNKIIRMQLTREYDIIKATLLHNINNYRNFM